MSLIKEIFVYEVHSDVDENNIGRTFTDKDEAIEYARENRVDETYVERAVATVDDLDEIIQIDDNTTIWAYNEDE